MSGLVLQTMKSSCMVFSLKQYVSGLAVRQRKIGCAAAPGGLQGKKIRVQFFLLGTDLVARWFYSEDQTQCPGGLQGNKIRVQKISVEYLRFQGGDLLP